MRNCRLKVVTGLGCREVDGPNFLAQPRGPFVPKKVSLQTGSADPAFSIQRASFTAEGGVI